MAYEAFKRTKVRSEEPKISIAPDGRIIFNAASTRILLANGVKQVRLLWDKSIHRMALKAASKNDRDAFAVSGGNDRKSASLRAMSFLRYVAWRAPDRTMLDTTWNSSEHMFEVVLPQKYLGGAEADLARKVPKP